MTIHLNKDSIYKCKRLVDFKDKQRKKAISQVASDLSILKYPNKIKVTYE